MTRLDIKKRVLSKLDENVTVPVYYTLPEIDTFIDEGQNLFAFLTFCLEGVVTLALLASTSQYDMLAVDAAVHTDWIAPLRIRVLGGAKLQPDTITGFRAFSDEWKALRGAPKRYAHIGFARLVICPCPAATGTTLSITKARTPAALASDTAVPEIPAKSHTALVDYAVWRARTKEGGQELIAGRSYLEAFMAEVQLVAGQVRVRARAAGYDRLPPETKLAPARR